MILLSMASTFSWDLQKYDVRNGKNMSVASYRLEFHSNVVTAKSSDQRSRKRSVEINEIGEKVPWCAPASVVCSCIQRSRKS